MLNRGEIRWFLFAAPDRKRPVLLLTRDSIINRLGEVTIAQITSTIRDIPSEVFLSEADGMPRDCVVNCDHLHSVGRGKIGSLITTLPHEKMRQVATAIDFALDLSGD